MPTPTIRVLLAEDYQPFRSFLSSTIQAKLAWNDVHEVADGSDAVQKAQELQPELVLLDIGLPKLNGIEAARQIKTVSPDSKILFVSQETSADVVEEALKTGAEGYVCKMDAGGELLAAIDAVLRGEKYLSKSLSSIPASNADSPPTQTAVVRPQPLQIDKAHSHEVGFYCDEQSLLDGFTLFAGTALKTAKAAIVLATERHQEALLARLQASGLDMSTAIEQGRYVALQPAETLSSFMVDGLPDPVRFHKAAVDLIVKTAESVDGDTSRVTACGECAPLLWQSGNAEAAVRLEQLWDEIGKSYEVQIFCGYLLASFQGGIGSFVFERICKVHSAVLSR
jgi:DNA-binding NarL/FixJ family response regulator